MPTPVRFGSSGFIGSFKRALDSQVKLEPKPAPKHYLLQGFIDDIGPGGKYFKYARIALISVVLIFAVLVLIIVFPNLRKLFTKPPSSPPGKVVCTKSPSPLPKGFQSWTMSYGNGVTGPKIQTVTIDTLTPPMGGTQTLTANITNGTTVTKAAATVYTDNTNTTYDLEMIKGSATDGTWQGIWKINDTTSCIYRIDFFLDSPSGSWTGALTFR